MNAKFATVALLAAAAAATSTFAGEVTLDDAAFAPSRTRAEVQSELARHQQSGVNTYSISYNPLNGFRSVKTRAQVQQEYLDAPEQARAALGEDSGSAALAQAAGPAVRTQVAGQPATVR